MLIASFLSALALSAQGCRGHLPVDPSPVAVANGERNLGMQGCSTVPSRGFDVCRVVEGSLISTIWVLLLPFDEKTFINGEVELRFKDQVRSYKIQGSQLEIPLNEVFRDTDWKKKHDTIIQAKARVKIKDGEFERFVELLGFMFVVVLKPGYTPLPYDSGLVYTRTKACHVAYTTSGRSYVACSED